MTLQFCDIAPLVGTRFLEGTIRASYRIAPQSTKQPLARPGLDERYADEVDFGCLLTNVRCSFLRWFAQLAFDDILGTALSYLQALGLDVIVDAKHSSEPIGSAGRTTFKPMKMISAF